ncbi:MAG TPA: DUF4282 domain-containing protein [Brevefilum fermentans]|uniref:DUF4282 domain-containing protein n=1 Tax=Candidatus Brevifilum fermentans TaxID=1986204 RepID=A0A1Y6K1H5_9CHLR|nr:DUF4282 domain-containing protein [Brevefilum fermentans]MDI9565526.1 DUF4282 domain-containing protein [Chloroflexota bacterium]OQB87289.1 MAG: hypothetical protein BWX85_00331 [Chloroflexi bacterium ADurb.Bin120]SMX53542.1 conserved protein of unknown function [Brevefilum fermentans]HOM67057.1 DUF4282 domain-containing protein [Brevefilum fermentans]HPX95677.1 DUF4282 domain-containing protein [Brevefilum fermentans]
MKFKNFLSFERMITPVIIKVLFYIGLVVSVIGGIVVFIGSVIAGFADGGVGSILLGLIGGLIGGVLTVFLGVLATRIYAELLILFFRINETLTDIKGLLQEK